MQLPADATLYPHRALYDCYVTAALLQRIIKDSGWTPEQMVQITEQPVLLKKFKFGKYRGQEIDRIAGKTRLSALDAEIHRRSERT